MIDRDTFLDWIDDYCAGALDPEQRRAVEVYLEAHPEARAELARQEGLRRAFADLPRPAAPADLRASVLDRLRDQTPEAERAPSPVPKPHEAAQPPQPTSRFGRRLRPVPLRFLQAAAVLLLCASIWKLSQVAFRPSPSPVPSASQETQNSESSDKPAEALSPELAKERMTGSAFEVDQARQKTELSSSVPAAQSEFGSAFGVWKDEGQTPGLHVMAPAAPGLASEMEAQQPSSRAVGPAPAAPAPSEVMARGLAAAAPPSPEGERLALADRVGETTPPPFMGQEKAWAQRHLENAPSMGYMSQELAQQPGQSLAGQAREPVAAPAAPSSPFETQIPAKEAYPSPARLPLRPEAGVALYAQEAPASKSPSSSAFSSGRPVGQATTEGSAIAPMLGTAPSTPFPSARGRLTEAQQARLGQDLDQVQGVVTSSGGRVEATLPGGTSRVTAFLPSPAVLDQVFASLQAQGWRLETPSLDRADEVSSPMATSGTLVAVDRAEFLSKPVPGAFPVTLISPQGSRIILDVGFVDQPRPPSVP